MQFIHRFRRRSSEEPIVVTPQRFSEMRPLGDYGAKDRARFLAQEDKLTRTEIMLIVIVIGLLLAIALFPHPGGWSAVGFR